MINVKTDKSNGFIGLVPVDYAIELKEQLNAAMQIIAALVLTGDEVVYINKEQAELKNRDNIDYFQK